MFLFWCGQVMRFLRFAHKTQLDNFHLDSMLPGSYLLCPDLKDKYAVLQTWVRDSNLREHNQRYHIMQIANPNILWQLRSPYSNMEKQMETEGFISAHTWHSFQNILTSSAEKGKFLERTYLKSLVTPAWQRPAWVSSKLYLLDSAE